MMDWLKDAKVTFSPQEESKEIIERVRRHAKESKVENDRHKKEEARLDHEQEDFDKKAVQIAKRLVKEDMEVMLQLREAANGLMKFNASEIQERLFKTFCAIFDGVEFGSKTVIVVDRKENPKTKEDITVGSFGFGIRSYEKSRRLRSYYDVKQLMDMREIVEKGLKARGFEKAAGWFAEFCDIVSSIPMTDDSTISLKFALRNSQVLGESTTIKGLLMSGNRYGHYSGRRLDESESGVWAVGENEAYTVAIVLSDPEPDQAKAYLLVRDELLERSGEFIAEAAAFGQNYERMFAKLQEKFGKQLLLRQAI